MGIKNYLPNLTVTIINNIVYYDSIYLDCNYIIHLLIHNCLNDDELYEKTVDYCKKIFKYIKINKSINIIFDGENEHIYDPKENTHIERDKQRMETTEFIYSKQHIGRKSNIIQYFQKIMVDIIEDIKNISMSDYEIILSNSSIAGEADIKILNKIYENNEHKKICIVSKDTDLIQISFVNALYKNIDVDVLITISNDIKCICSSTIQQLPTPLITSKQNIITKHNYDYIFIIALLGNDYLPKISNVDYNCLMKSYTFYKII